MNAPKSQSLYLHAKERIPGGVQLLSKRPENMAPGEWPPYSARARGCEVADLDGNRYLDFSTNGIGACLLGYADPEVTEAVVKVVRDGSMSSLNPPEEVELADRLCAIHPWAEQVRFARTGGETLAVAVRIARATTDRSMVLVSGYHGWSDWYLACNLGDSDNLRGMWLAGISPWGVPRELRGTAEPVNHGDTEKMSDLIEKHKNELAAIVLEPCRHERPEPGFLELIRRKCDEYGIVMIFDEVTIGWRYRFGGAHLNFGVTPDIAVFAKALGNGHPIGAVIGTRRAMAGAEKTFLSSTYWTERTGPAAALAALRRMEETRVWEHVRQVGVRVMELWRGTAAECGLPLRVTSTPEFGCLASFTFDVDGVLKRQLRTLYTRMMLEEGFLATGGFYPTLAHTGEHVERFAAALKKVFPRLAEVARKGTGPLPEREVALDGFQRLVK